MASKWTRGIARWSVLGATSLAVALLAPAFAQAAAGWSTGAPMSVDRIAHTQTLLRDGDVLVTGGQALAPWSSLSSAERYHPATNSWTAVAAMHADRLSHSATLLADGRVLVAGGMDTNSAALASAELYDPALGTWTLAAPMANARRGHSATLMEDGRVLVAGGSGQSSTVALTSAELYDPVANSWTAAGPLTQRRRLHAAVQLPDGDVLVAGGYATAFNATAAVERYDLTANTWTTVAPMAFRRADSPLVVLRDGRLLAIGGDDAGPEETATTEAYDPTADAWQPGPTMSVPRWASSATVLTSGDVLATGLEETTELLTPGADAWRAAGSVPAGIETMSYAQRLLDDGRVLLTGGEAPANVAIYTPETTADAASADFGDVYAGQRSPLLWVTVENTGREPLFVERAEVTGPNAAAFAAERETCTTAPIAPGARCRVAVRFTPSATGAAEASLVLADNEADGQLVVELDGIGVAAPVGTPGSDGARGPAGPTGPAGVPGTAGPRGSSKLPRVTCRSKLLRARGRRAQRVKTTCKVTLARAPGRTATVRVRNRGRTLASGRVRPGRRTLTLRAVTATAPRGPVSVEVR
ncbi:kelch repeat-containing protein [Conexibacter woesei]|uniref:Kelch repeat-containing protein n=1 Tax=Conexibacter woesei (strain DSM 14684 / CCUG 47730 / CIP 108061 / JCM 11494 / NBRC 100937 / ID131577) TaxID=469383 RepID=D3EZ24_CONWI|nr:kelch repeat-containing protein [Conexibacter woesei]ADB49898.1 Kelch repeat-containing protein [Conexibacter woesei DSM 14684]